MAVVRIEADGPWFLKAARGTVAYKRMSRELLRAAGRPGRVAELTASEARMLEVLYPDDERVLDAVARVIAVEEQERVGLKALRARMDERRGAPGT